MQLTHRAISLLRGNRVALPVDRTSISMRRAIGLMTFKEGGGGHEHFPFR
jgi:hypothetical protein